MLNKATIAAAAAGFATLATPAFSQDVNNTASSACTGPYLPGQVSFECAQDIVTQTRDIAMRYTQATGNVPDDVSKKCSAIADINQKVWQTMSYMQGTNLNTAADKALACQYAILSSGVEIPGVSTAQMNTLNNTTLCALFAQTQFMSGTYTCNVDALTDQNYSRWAAKGLAANMMNAYVGKYQFTLDML